MDKSEKISWFEQFKIFVFLADGFEEIEGLIRSRYAASQRSVTVSIGSSRNIIGAHRIEVEADIMFHEASSIVCTSWRNAWKNSGYEGLGKVLKKAYKNNK